MDDLIATITEPRHKWAKEKAKEMWTTHCDGKVPVILNDIVRAFGIAVKGATLSVDGVSRIESDGTCMIMYNMSMAEVRQRFTVAHELGHFALGHIEVGGESSQLSNKSQEAEANTFAGELLVPSGHLRNFMRAKDKTIEHIMKQYWISKDAASTAVLRNKLINKLKTPA